MGATATTTNPSDFANRTQTYFNPKLLKALLYNLKLAGYGLSEGYKTIGPAIRFFRPRKANLAGINAQTITFNITPATTPTALSEGVAPTNLTEVGVGYVDITMTQRAGLSKLTDRLQAIDLLNTLQVYSTTLGMDAALDYDTVIRNQLVNGLYNSDATYANGDDGGYFERFAGVANSGDSSNDFTTLVGASQTSGRMTRLANLAMVTQLKTSKVPKIGGRYVCVTPPQVIHDMRQDATWVQTGTYQDKNALFKDLEIDLDGVAFVEANNPWIENAYGVEVTSGSPAAAKSSYSNIYLGADAFGIPNLTNKQAGGSQSAPKLIVLNSPDKADPLNQITTLGWKAFWGAGPFVTTVNQERPRYGILRTLSTFIAS